MEKILVLLDERNRFLTKFLLVTEEEEIKFRAGNFQGLDRFYDQRETLLEMVRHTEKLIDAHLNAKPTSTILRSSQVCPFLHSEPINP